MPPRTRTTSLACCSSAEAFEAEHDGIVGRKVEQSMVRDEAKEACGENPDCLDRTSSARSCRTASFFGVVREAIWSKWLEDALHLLQP